MAEPQINLSYHEVLSHVDRIVLRGRIRDIKDGIRKRGDARQGLAKVVLGETLVWSCFKQEKKIINT